jgi:hypothetical protein
MFYSKHLKNIVYIGASKEVCLLILITLPLRVGVPRIELGPNAPKAFILPLYYTPPSPAEACYGGHGPFLVREAGLTYISYHKIRFCISFTFATFLSGSA